MEAKGRGSAVVALVVVLMVVQCEMSVAAIYTVGGAAGWTFNMVGWPRGKRFRAGDILVFNYNRAAHNVVAVNKAAYDSCKAPRGAGQYQTGRDRIKLAKGPNYFVCTFPGHCEAGMKIAVTAA
ncbi:hypothetical protein Nepgr_026932 [Nepenthes gracilis]|uniref:Basic blue protein n=1 Tax=Nepenthes gracilis TaxID=150966 RepID=A0AAD3T9A1_NEPGR|nr:hypothetical protein Nepgr_026932 [Nepenthes gracilis]